jgi:DNA damage-binding protein 1
VLLAPPNAHLLLVIFTSTPTPALVIAASLPLTPPTPSLRQAEFYTSVIAQGNVALVSLWVGVLSCIEIDVEKDKDRKRRPSEVRPETKPLTFRDNFNIK